MARGNLALGLGLHYTRMLTILAVMPAVPRSMATKLVLLAWSLTEVCRYPMFIWPASPLARKLRYLAPVATFPVGALSEAAAAYLSLPHLTGGSLLRLAVQLVVPTNILGGVSAYP